MTRVTPSLADCSLLDASPPYRISELSVDERVADLLARMTLEEKAGQLQTVNAWTGYTRNSDELEPSDWCKAMIRDRHVGAFYGLLRADPWTGVTLQTGLSPREGAEAANAIQRYALENTRLGIPLLFAAECSHGHMALGNTVFPTAIGQASTWNTSLIQKMAAAIGTEIRLSGANVGYGPILDLARDPRWSRTEETYGEDPILCREMGVAMVRGLQGERLDAPTSIVSTLKHFAAHGETQGGHNAGAVNVGPRELHETLLVPFKAAIDAGAGSVMSSYNEIDGIPCSINRELLTDILRRQWGFDGFVVSDCCAIETLINQQKVAADVKQAITRAINAGVDSDLPGDAFGSSMILAAKAGLVSAHVLDRAVSRVLRIKFLLGLFENPYTDPRRAEQQVGSAEYRALALEVARESITLLKNEKSLLPLQKNISSIAVIGPNADHVYNMLGDYTAPQAPGTVATVLEGIRRQVSPHTIVRYAKGCGIRATSKEEFGEALDAVRQSSVAVVVLGGSSARDFGTHFAENGAAISSMDSYGSEMESGEGFDRASLDLCGVQLELLQQIVQIGKPVVLVLIKGRPLILNWAAAHVAAIMDAWYPGAEGGNAIADVLFGNYNPAGRLPISVPRSVGQLPVYYNFKPHSRPDYSDMSAAPLYPFGYGLSFSEFRYSGLSVFSANGEFDVKVAFEVTNTGIRDGDEVVQLYLRHSVSSVTTPVKSLKAFRRIHLMSCETQTVCFDVCADDFSILDASGRWCVEEGRVELMVGASSDDIRLQTSLELRLPRPALNA